jgi:UDP-N-acetylglucosamine 2-epimerase (non-hydrolysing)
MLAKYTNAQVTVVVGTRPEIVKLAPIVRILGATATLIHSGQHTDNELSGVFFTAAGLPEPETLSGICAQPRHVQVARIVDQLGARFERRRPAAVLVQGDTNTAHVEAGLRSFDRQMPEELNRCLIGVLADLHCAPTERAVANLLAEGVPSRRVVLTGNTIVEATRAMMPSDQAAAKIVAGAGAEPGRYVLATIHRPENTDDPDRLRVILDELSKLGLPVLLPLHPRTRLAAQRHGLEAALDRLVTLPPADHRTFLGLARHARLLVSDSGGVQEECTVLKRPLIVVRNSTERPESIDAGFAHLVQPGPDLGHLGRELIGDEGLSTRLARVPCPYGDGTASEQIAGCLRSYLN